VEKQSALFEEDEVEIKESSPERDSQILVEALDEFEIRESSPDG